MRVSIRRVVRQSYTAEQQDAAPALPGLADIERPREQKAVGCLVGSLAGASLGLSVEPERHFRIMRLFPEGLLDPWRFSSAPGARRAPGDAAAAVAAARSLAAVGRAELGALLDELARSYSPASLEYSPYTRLVLDALAAGVDPFSLASLADDFLNVGTSRTASTSSDRIQRQPFGAADHGAALRCAPLGLAYAAAGDEALVDAVDTWALFSHPADQGRDGALAAAAAVAWLSKEGRSGTPEALLERLEQIVATEDMREKLAVVRRCLETVGQLPLVPPTTPGSSSAGGGSSSSGGIGSWRQFWQSDEWGRLVEANNLLTHHGFATLGTQAAAVALLALCANWQHPQQAVSIAASLGGSSSTTAALTGALAGSLHGCSWIPQRWWDALGESREGRALRDRAMEAALGIADVQISA